MTKFNSINFKNKNFLFTNRRKFLVSGMSLGIYSLLRPGLTTLRDTRIPVENGWGIMVAGDLLKEAKGL